MKKTMLVLAVVAAFGASSAWADRGEGNNTGCNGKGNANSPCGSTVTPQPQVQPQPVVQPVLNVGAVSGSFGASGGIAAAGGIGNHGGVAFGMQGAGSSNTTTAWAGGFKTVVPGLQSVGVTTGGTSVSTQGAYSLGGSLGNAFNLGGAAAGSGGAYGATAVSLPSGLQLPN